MSKHSSELYYDVKRCFLHARRDNAQSNGTREIDNAIISEDVRRTEARDHDLYDGSDMNTHAE